MSPGMRQFSVAVVIVILLVATSIYGQEECSINGSTVVCDTILPKVIPDNVSEVIVNDFRQASIDNKTFDDKSWRSVYFLDITVNLQIKFRLYDNNFVPLRNLKTLGIHSPGLTMSGDKRILYGLSKLQVLNLASCYRFKTHELFNLLNDNKTELDTLVLDQTSISENRQLLMNNFFFELISKHKIRKVSLSGCNLIVQGPFHFDNFSFSWRNVNVSNTTISFRNITDIFDILQLRKLARNLKVVDMSEISERFWDLNYTDLTWCYISLNNLEYLFSNHISSRKIIINNSFYDLSDCKVYLKVLHLRSNNINYFNRTTIWPNKTRLMELDLSFNDMEYLSPNAYGGLTTLKIFLLAHNNLFSMAHFSEFKDLFVSFRKLRHLDLSHNKLNWLPYEMFVNNDQLMILDLSGNKLNSVRFKFEHLRKLKLFNLEDNRILYIDGVELKKLVLLSTKLAKTSRISFYDNPLLCSCDSEQFIKWLYYSVYTKKLKAYECSLNDKRVFVDVKTLKKTHFLCIRSKIIIASVISGVGIISILTLVTCFRVRRKKRRRRKLAHLNFMEEFNNGELREKFLCFLSFSNEDEEYCINEIYTNLGKALQTLLKTENETICIGDRGFRSSMKY